MHLSWRRIHDLPMTSSGVLTLSYERIARESAIRLGYFENCILCKLTFCETCAKTCGNFKLFQLRMSHLDAKSTLCNWQYLSPLFELHLNT